MGPLRTLYRWLPVWLPMAVAAVLTLSDTWGALDYHACLALSPIVGLCALGYGSRDKTVPGAWAALTLGPLGVLLLARLWVPNCQVLTGLQFYALGPVGSAWVGLGWSRLGRLLAPRYPRWTAWLGALASAGLPAWHFLTQPQVFAYHGLTGFIAGALYEDAVSVGAAYWTYRATDLVLWLPVVTVTRDRWTRGLAVAELALLAALLVQADALSWRIRNVEADLSVKIDASPQFRLHLPETRTVRAHLQIWQRDVAFRYAELTRAFGTAPDSPIDLYFYSDSGQKQRLMGANRVDMAKPWLGQVHMVLPEGGSTTLTHELAHVFAAQWANSPLGIPLRHGLIPDAVAIEGLAVAMEWPVRANLDPHQWTRAMRLAGLAPQVQSLWSLSGFLGQQSDRAYTVAGSFLRWLGETRGWPVVRRVYAGEPLEVVTGEPLTALADAWGQFVDDPVRHPLTDDDLSRAKLRFARQGLFEKPCALETGRACQRADRLGALGRPERALTVRRQLLDSIGLWVAVGVDDPELHLDLADDYAQAGRPRQALAELDSLKARTGPARLHPLLAASVDVACADVLWRQGQVGQAETLWRRVASQPLSESMLRTLEVKLHFSRQPAASDAMRALWLTGAPASGRGRVDWLLQELAENLPEDPIAQSLWGRRLLGMGEVKRGLTLLNAVTGSALLEAPWTARESARQVMWRHVLEPQFADLPWWTRWVAESASPASVVAEWQRREAEPRKTP